MAERQIHGFNYENKIIEQNNLKKQKYNNKWDTYEIINDKKYPVSSKCIKLNSGIDLGDLKRQAYNDEDFILYIGFWKNSTDNIVEEYKILITKENWNSYFGEKSIIESMLNELKDISNDSKDNIRWADYRKKHRTLYGKAIIALRFKRDSKTQKRIQCGITKSNFYNTILKENEILNFSKNIN